MRHPMQPSYRWNGEAESSWGRLSGWDSRYNQYVAMMRRRILRYGIKRPGQ